MPYSNGNIKYNGVTSSELRVYDKYCEYKL